MAALESFVPNRADVRGYITAGFFLTVSFVVAVVFWAALTPISGAVIAPATVVVENNSKKVQHPNGGVVGEILVKDGDSVEAEQVVMRLDETVTRANLALVTKQLDEIAIRTARLMAEIEGRDSIVVPDDITRRRDEPHIATSLATELALFNSRAEGRRQQVGQLKERIEQLRQQAEGIAAQEQARRTEVELAKKERDALDILANQSLINIAQVTLARRTVVQLEGNLAEVMAQGASVRSRIAETQLQILSIGQAIKSEAGKDLRDQQAKQAELSERRVSAQDLLKRVDIRAPQSGTVHQLAVHTLGGVVGAGEPLMLIVPRNDRLVLDAHVAPQDIDQITPGATARVRFNAFNHRTTPEYDATVATVSPDVMTEPVTSAASRAGMATQSQAPFYTVRVELQNNADLDTYRLLPGMQAQVFITTEDRTALSFFLKPLKEQFEPTFRER